MGAQANIVDSVHIFIAIAAHKGLAAYALGSSVVDSQVCCPPSQSLIRQKCSTCFVGMSSRLCVHWDEHQCTCKVDGSTAEASGSSSGPGPGLVLRWPCLLEPDLSPAAQASMQKFWTVIGFFATATPVGILLGVLLSSVSNSDAAAAVSALASGAATPFLVRGSNSEQAAFSGLPAC